MVIASHGPPDSAPRATIAEEPGQKLKRVRERLRLKFRDVEEASQLIAVKYGNDEFTVALSRLADIENKGTMPSLYRLYSLCAIYRLEITEVLSWYGLTLSNLPSDAMLVNLERTHLMGFHPEDGEVQVPVALDPGIDLTKTLFLSRMVQRWGKLPLMMLNQLDLRNYRYGLIGTDDWSMYPILPPGAVVVIDEARRKVANSGWSNEFERPIYFLEHREGYLCGWCTLRDGQLTFQPHPASLCEPESFAYPREVEVVGQVTHVAMTLGKSPKRS